MKQPPYFDSPKDLEDAARLAEQRKRRAIDRLTERLAPPGDRFVRSMETLIDADKRATQEKAR